MPFAWTRSGQNSGDTARGNELAREKPHVADRGAQRLRRFAACMRRHGVPGLPDPKVVDGKVVLMLPRGLTAKSPRLKKAQHACRKHLPEGPNTQPGTRTGPTTTRPGSG